MDLKPDDLVFREIPISEAILTIDVKNDKEVAIRIVKNGVKLLDITMGDIENWVNTLKGGQVKCQK